MITQKKWEKAGYSIVANGGWMVIDPQLLGGEWGAMAKSLGFDPECKEVVLGITAIKQIHNEDKK